MEVYVLPPARRNVLFSCYLPNSITKESINLPFPYVVFTKNRNLKVFFAQEQPAKNTKLFHSMLPNVYDNQDVCLQLPYSTGIEFGVDLFWQTYFSPAADWGGCMHSIRKFCFLGEFNTFYKCKLNPMKGYKKWSKKSIEDMLDTKLKNVRPQFQTIEKTYAYYGPWS